MTNGILAEDHDQAQTLFLKTTPLQTLSRLDAQRWQWHRTMLVLNPPRTVLAPHRHQQEMSSLVSGRSKEKIV